jgi:inorganic pyrophosphatase
LDAATNGSEFWSRADDLVTTSTVIIDRPRGSAHPHFADVVYPLDYGYLKPTLSVDGDGIDVWVGSLVDHRLCGAIVTIDSGKRDAEIKLLLGCSRTEAELAMACHNRGSQTAILLWRGEESSHVSKAVEVGDVS